MENPPHRPTGPPRLPGESPTGRNPFHIGYITGWIIAIIFVSSVFLGFFMIHSENEITPQFTAKQASLEKQCFDEAGILSDTCVKGEECCGSICFNLDTDVCCMEDADWVVCNKGNESCC